MNASYLRVPLSNETWSARRVRRPFDRVTPFAPPTRGPPVMVHGIFTRLGAGDDCVSLARSISSLDFKSTRRCAPRDRSIQALSAPVGCRARAADEPWILVDLVAPARKVSEETDGL